MYKRQVGTSWTVGAAFGAITGLPLKLPINVNGMSRIEEFFLGATTLGDILKEDGYTNVLMTDCDSTFGGQAMLYDQHGDHLILDLKMCIRDSCCSAHGANDGRALWPPA